MTTESRQPDDFFVSPEITTTTGIMASGVNTAKYTPVMIDATAGTFKVWDGSPGKAVGITAMAVNASGGQLEFSYYNRGTFRASYLNWSADATKRKAAFAGTAIDIQE